MAVVTRAATKAYFETGDKPTQSQFIDFIDSALFQEDASTLGKALVSAATTASAQNLLGIPGINPPGTVGNILLAATTTASAQNNIGGGTIGKILFESVTTASVVNQLSLGAIPTTAAQSDQETGTTGAKFVSPSVQQYHPSAAKAWVYITYSAGTPSAAASYNAASITDTGVGNATVNLSVSMSTANYAVISSISAGVNSVARNQSLATGSFGVIVTDLPGLANSDQTTSSAAYGDQ